MTTDSSVQRAGFAQGLTVIIAGFLPILAIVSMFPAVPAMIAHFGDDPNANWKVPAMVSAPGLTIAIVALFAGVLVDKFGRRKLLLAATLVYGLFGALPFLLESLDAIYASRLALGLAEAVILTTLNTLIADYWAEDGRRNWLTLQGLVGPALSSVMIFFAGSLAAWRWNGIFLLYLVAFPIFLAMLRWMYEPASDATARRMLGMDEDRSASRFPWPTVLSIGALTLFASALYYVFIINGGLVWKELGVADPHAIGQISALPTLFILVGAVIFWWMGKRGLSSRVQIATFLAILGSGLAIMGLATDWRWMIAGMVVQQTGAGMAIPSLIAWAQSKLPFAHRGRGMGVWTACFFFGQFSSPLLINVISRVAGTMQGAFLVAGLIGVAGAIGVALLLGRRERAMPAPMPA
ncbi:MFS transporter [Sphingomonas sp. Y38-1Y]|uniref:MFS transporter n=1 Tax=Sphingomonas sp. Y38-1Y TaxID=3078265 RepID=UPI0028EB2FD8|nr:MFS transporter [Sphingomonas sp. Y38-1Y]